MFYAYCFTQESFQLSELDMEELPEKLKEKIHVPFSNF
jgi:hypothetical protein